MSRFQLDPWSAKWRILAFLENLAGSVMSVASMARRLSFDRWKNLLRDDCIALNKLPAFDGIGERILKILYENGVDPTVESIVRDGLTGKKR